MLRGQNLTLIYPDGTGIRSLSVDVERGEANVLMGPSGSGKTTLLRVLCLLEMPQEGVVELDGLRFAFPREQDCKPCLPYPRVTIVFQQLFLWPHLSNRRNLELPLSRESQKRGLDVLIERFALSPFLDKYPNQCSLGQQQRIAIARALALSPEYLLLDEATSALDWELTQCVAQVLLEAKEQGLGLLVVTHDEGFAKVIAAPILRLENGRFVPLSNSKVVL